mgnify:CR=1 FL=1
MDKLKIIDKIHKCLRLSESANSNEAAAALRQAQALMRKYEIKEEDVQSSEIHEALANSGGYFNPPYWAVALSELIAQAFECRAYISRKDDERPVFRFIGVDYNASIGAYTFTVLYRQLRRSRRQYMDDLGLDDNSERLRQGNVFAQAWLFRIAKTVSEFIAKPKNEQAIEDYVKANYGETMDFERDPADPESKDYDVILSGMRAAKTVQLRRSVNQSEPQKGIVEQCA